MILPELRRIFLTQLKDEMEIVDLPHIAPVCRDPDDDKVIATAIYGNVITWRRLMTICKSNRLVASYGRKGSVLRPLMRF